MRAVIQRVKNAQVTVEGRTTGQIKRGLLVLLGIEGADNQEDIAWLSNKIAGLRIFPDDEGVMNRSVIDINGEVLLVSQFTLHARVKKGFRPSYIDAAHPDRAIPLYDSFIHQLETDLGKSVQTGEFGASMEVSLINDGPVTIWIDTKNKQ